MKDFNQLVLIVLAFWVFGRWFKCVRDYGRTCRPLPATRTDPAVRAYLAIPYSDVDKSESYRLANLFTASLTKQGFYVFSPISMSHNVPGLPSDWKFWEGLDTSFIEWADELHVVTMEGWKESTGVQAEIKIAERLGKPVHYIGGV